MEFEERLTVIFLEFIKQSIDYEYFIDGITELIEKQRVNGFFSDITNLIIKDQNSLFSKIVHIYSITIFETFNQDFFTELSKEKALSIRKFRTRPSKILKFFENNFQLNLGNEFKLWEDLKENICRRNVITHNMGKIDQQYIDCVNNPKSLLENKIIGKDIKHNLEYIKKSNKTVGKYIVFIFKKIAKFYNFIDIKSTVRNIAENGYFSDVNPDLLDDVKI